MSLPLKNFYFTFGQGHVANDGTPMKDYYVKVTAIGWMQARQLFIEGWTTKKMSSPEKWAFQYTEAEYPNCVAKYGLKEIDHIGKETE